MAELEALERLPAAYPQHHYVARLAAALWPGREIARAWAARARQIDGQAEPVKIAPEGMTTPDTIIDAVQEHFGISREAITGRCRKHRNSKPRFIGYFLMREILGLSLPEISHHFSRRNHTSVLRGIRWVKEARRSSPAINAAVMELFAALGAEERKECGK